MTLSCMRTLTALVWTLAMHTGSFFLLWCLPIYLQFQWLKLILCALWAINTELFIFLVQITIFFAFMPFEVSQFPKSLCICCLISVFSIHTIPSQEALLLPLFTPSHFYCFMPSLLFSCFHVCTSTPRIPHNLSVNVYVIFKLSLSISTPNFKCS